MPANESPTPASRPTQRSSRSSPSPGTGRSSPALENDTRNSLSRLNGSMSLVPARLSTPVNLSASASANNSTNSSREASPVRLTSRVVSSNHQNTANRSFSRHKNSASPSPSRGVSGTGPTSTPTTISSTLSPAAVQKAFAQLSKPDLQQPTSAADENLDVSDPDRSSMPPPRTSRRRSSITNGSRSPSLSRSTTSKRSETTTAASEPLANISTKRTYVSPEEGRVSPVKTAHEDGDLGARRSSGRGAGPPGTVLETVEESSVPSTPISKPTNSRVEDAPPKSTDTALQAVESGSESGGNKSSESKEGKRRPSASRPPGVIPPQRSFTSLNSGRGKPSDGSVRNMIVETETVSSIPQVSLGVGAGERGNSARNDQGGTIRMKPSVETIRPKKEKKKTTRKQPNVLPGTVSSKADIFEAKVASAIDDADVSDSDETFVYESNPPEPLPNRHRYHSRTPSATSMASQAEQYANRTRLAARESNGPTIKRSMKFTNNHNSNLDSDLGDIDQRSVSGRADNNGHSGRHHHIVRYGRGGAYPSLFDTDSPFPQSQQPRSPRHITGGFRQGRRGNTPRSHSNYRTLGGPKSMSDDYPDDFDADGADDERTPLVSSVRHARNRVGRRPGSASMRQMEYLEQRQRGCFSLYGGCIIASLLILILIGGAATFLIALMRPLLDVQVTKLSNVLASEQEIMIDVQVNAINPNIFPISIANMDVNIFARSRYVGSDKFWREHGPHPPDFPRIERSKLRARLAELVRLPLLAESEVESDSDSLSAQFDAMDNVDHGTDPIDDPSSDAQTMLLGRVFSFDSPVILDPSPWRRIASDSVGEIRLTKPGNKTEEGGTERWERVLQHPFELIVRGVFKYSLPLASGMRSASISAKIQVLPNDAGDGDEDSKPGTPGNETVHITSIEAEAEADLEIEEPSLLISRIFSS